MKKREAIELFVQRDMQAVPLEWVQIVAEKKNLYIYAWCMWGTMFIVDNFVGEKLMNNAVMVVEPSECENHDICDTCDICEDYEEMGGAYNIKDKDGYGTSAYIYDIDGEYVIGVHGAGFNFYDGVWDKIYDALGLKWHDEKILPCRHCRSTKTTHCHEQSSC